MRKVDEFLALIANKPVNQFVQACALGQLDNVRQQISAGADINQIDTTEVSIPEDVIFDNLSAWIKASERSGQMATYGMTGAHTAAKNHDEALLRLLGENNADFFILSSHDYSVLDEAIESGFMAGVKYLLEEKRLLEKWPHDRKGSESILERTMRLRDPINAAAMLNYLITVHKLNWRKARSITNMDLLETTEGWHHYQSAFGDTKRYQDRNRTLPSEVLLKAGWDLNQPGSIVKPLKMSFSEQANGVFSEVLGEDFVEDLENRSIADKVVKGYYTGFALHRVAYAGDIRHVQLYLRYNAQASLKNEFGQTAIDAATAALGDEMKKLEEWNKTLPQSKWDIEYRQDHRKKIADLIEIKTMLQDAINRENGNNLANLSPAP